MSLQHCTNQPNKKPYQKMQKHNEELQVSREERTTALFIPSITERILYDLLSMAVWILRT